MRPLFIFLSLLLISGFVFHFLNVYTPFLILPVYIVLIATLVFFVVYLFRFYLTKKIIIKSENTQRRDDTP
ncbi:hypothetical protein PAEAM_49030 [Paenibacillus sp. GM1FR]|nr:hypothetical protein PAEAM_49030 [Paenibacillus sp. GM1FR]